MELQTIRYGKSASSKEEKLNAPHGLHENCELSYIMKTCLTSTLVETIGTADREKYQ